MLPFYDPFTGYSPSIPSNATFLFKITTQSNVDSFFNRYLLSSLISFVRFLFFFFSLLLVDSPFPLFLGSSILCVINDFVYP